MGTIRYIWSDMEHGWDKILLFTCCCCQWFQERLIETTAFMCFRWETHINDQSGSCNNSGGGIASVNPIDYSLRSTLKCSRATFVYIVSLFTWFSVFFFFFHILFYIFLWHVTRFHLLFPLSPWFMLRDSKGIWRSNLHMPLYIHTGD